MEILLDKRAVKQIRLSAQDAIEEGDTETLRDDILDSFSEDQVEEVERRIDTDFYDFLGDTLEEWSGEDVDEQQQGEAQPGQQKGQQDRDQKGPQQR